MRKIWRAIWNRRRFEDEMADELMFHVEARAADLERSGMPAREAMRQARVELGCQERYKEECRQARGLRWLDELRADLLYAVRGLNRNRGFAAMAVLTLTLGIGVNVTIFALVNSVMFKSLPVQKPQELQAIYWTLPEGKPTYHRNSSGRGIRENGLRVADMFSYPHFVRLRSELESKADLFGHSEINRVSVVIEGQAQLVPAAATSWNYCRGLGVNARIGRTFLPEDERPQATPVVLLSYDYWSRAFAENPAVVGQKLVVGTTPMVIAGVLPRDFHGVTPGTKIDLFLTLPAANDLAKEKRLSDATSWWVKLMARVRPDVAPEQFRQEVEARLVSMMRAEPVGKPYESPGIRLVSGERGLDWLRRETEKPLRLLMSVAVLILLMAVVNVSGLLLARSEARVSEIGARLALGASPLRLARQHFTESLVLGAIGLVGGLLVAWSLASSIPSLLARGGEATLIDLRPDWRFTVVSVLTMLTVTTLFGLYPAWKSALMDLTEVLKRSKGVRSGRLPMGRILVGAQVALSVVLLIGAGLFLRTVFNLRGLPLGFTPSKVLIFRSSPTLAGYQDEQLIRYFDRALEQLRRTPGITSVSLSRHGLLAGGSSSTNLYYRDLNGQLKALAGGQELYTHQVAAGYFETLRIPVLVGRGVLSSDTAKSAKVAMVNQRLAKILRPDGGSPVGMSLYDDDRGNSAREIVGVVGDARYDTLRDEPPATAYFPFEQRAIRSGTFIVKTETDPVMMAAAVRRTMAEVDPQVPIYDLRTQEEQISLAMERERVLAKLLTGFALLALVLASVGIYGVLSYSVARRTSEIGIRMTLGAAPGSLRWMVVRDSLGPVVIGLMTGLAGVWWFTGLVKSFVFGIQPMDAWSVAAGVAVLVMGACLAAWIPAKRASRVDPWVALRYE